MEVTFDLPDEVVRKLQPFEDRLPQILALGLREFNAIGQKGFSGIAEVLEFLASLPTESAIIALRPSEALQAQLSMLLEKNRTVGLNPAEEHIEHIVRMAKARAFLRPFGGKL